MTFGIYDADGKLRLTPAPGTGFVGLYAPDGSFYYTLAPDSGFCGVIAPNGSLFVINATGGAPLGQYASNGALRITTANELNGALKVSGFITVSAIIMESSSYFLLEDGSSKLLLEA